MALKVKSWENTFNQKCWFFGTPLNPKDQRSKNHIGSRYIKKVRTHIYSKVTQLHWYKIGFKKLKWVDFDTKKAFTVFEINILIK